MHIDCMPRSITIRDVPDATGDELAGRAARAGQSLQEFLRAHLMELADKPDVGLLLERVRERKSSTDSRVSVQEILDALDDGRGKT